MVRDPTLFSRFVRVFPMQLRAVQRSIDLAEANSNENIHCAHTIFKYYVLNVLSRTDYAKGKQAGKLWSVRFSQTLCNEK